MKESETQPSTSFFRSLGKVLTFNRNTKDDVPRVHLETFTEEKKRVDEIEKLLDEGRQQNALKELIKDTNVENPLRYYNQILRNENTSYPTDYQSKRNEKCREDESSKTCEWTGYNKKYNALWCSNKILYHPWKTIKNVYGQEENVMSKNCVYHQKYCSDNNKRHEGKMVKITIPNNKALCTECYIISEGVQPKKLSRYPGMRRKDAPQYNVLESGNFQEASNHLPMCASNRPKKGVTPPTTAIMERKSYIIPRPVLSTALAVCKIQKWWRKKRNVLRKISEMDFYKCFQIRNRAALKIQVCFRYHCLVTNIKNGYSVQSSFDIDNEESSAPQWECSPTTKRYEIRMKQIKAGPNHPQNLPLCLPCISPDLKKENISINSKPQKITKSEKGQQRQCELAACQVCHKTRINTAKGREKIITSQLGTQNGCDMPQERTFRSLDRFDLGSLPRRDFFQVVRYFYEKRGQPLLPEEARALINAFECRDGRDGHIDYVKFVAFAKNQIHPCLMHSRLICATCTTRSRYKANVNCKKFEPNPSQSAFCRCGKYKSRHEQLPIIEAIQETRRRGFQMFAEHDLQRTFDRKIKADTGLRSEIEFQSIKSATYRPGNAYPPPSAKKARDRKNLSTENKIVKAPKKCIKEKMESAAFSASDELIVNLPPESTNIPVPTPSERDVLFSANRLELMMDKCVEYRMYPSEPKPSIRCPLCKTTFYEKSKLQNHLKNRHSTEEIKHHVRALQPVIANPTVRVKVKWEGKYTIVPPLPSPVPLNLCYHHVPPHPKCRICKETLKHCELFPPIRFYPAAFVEVGKNEDGKRRAIPAQGADATSSTTLNSGSDNVDESERTRILKKNYHFTLDDSDLAVIVAKDDDSKCNTGTVGDTPSSQLLLGKLVAICEDGLQKNFLGLRFYHSKSDGKSSFTLSPLLEDKLLCSNNNRHTDELVMDTQISWIEMKNVIGRKHVFHCTRRQFEKKKVEMNVCAKNKIHFCQD